jgi:hypothetical protein
VEEEEEEDDDGVAAREASGFLASMSCEAAASLLPAAPTSLTPTKSPPPPPPPPPLVGTFTIELVDVDATLPGYWKVAGVITCAAEAVGAAAVGVRLGAIRRGTIGRLEAELVASCELERSSVHGEMCTLSATMRPLCWSRRMVWLSCATKCVPFLCLFFGGGGGTEQRV